MITNSKRLGDPPATESISIKRRSVALGTAILIVVIGWAAGIPKLWWSSSESPEPLSSAPHIAPPSVPSGVVPPMPQSNDLLISNAPLPLNLTGTMPGRNPQEGRALIGVNKNNPQTYQAGALLENGARIAAIYTDHVVLEKNGRSVKLYLIGSGKHTDVEGLADILTVGTPAPALAVEPPPREVLTDYIRPSPVFDGETIRGYQVYAGQKSAVFSQLGLQNGDIIVSINGAPLNEPQLAIAYLQQIAQGDSATAAVERDGELKTLLLNGMLIVNDQQRPVSSEMLANGPPM